MADEYTYNLIEATPFICQVIKHLTSSENSTQLSLTLKRELERWESCQSGVELKKGITCGEGVKIIDFPLLQKVQEQLKTLPLNNSTPTISELLRGSRIVFPWQQAPPRNPELVSRLEKIRASLDKEEYNRMVFGSKKKDDPELLKDIKLDVQATHRQLLTFFNFLFTVIGSFVFGYFAAYYAGLNTVVCVLVGLLMGLIVFFADLYFLMKNL